MKRRSGSEQVDGVEVRRLCARKGWGATELAKASKLSVRKCQQMMAGERARYATINEVAKALGVAPSTLLVGVYDPPAAPPASKFVFGLQLSGLMASPEQMAQLGMLTPRIIQFLESCGIQVSGISSTLATERIAPTGEEYALFLLQGNNVHGQLIYCYLKVDLPRLDAYLAVMQGEENFVISDYGDVLASGEGMPPPEVVAEVAAKYPMLDTPRVIRSIEG